MGEPDGIMLIGAVRVRHGRVRGKHSNSPNIVVTTGNDADFDSEKIQLPFVLLDRIDFIADFPAS